MKIDGKSTQISHTPTSGIRCFYGIALERLDKMMIRKLLGTYFFSNNV